MIRKLVKSTWIASHCHFTRFLWKFQKFTKVRKNSSKIVYILAKQCRSPFNLTNFFLTKIISRDFLVCLRKSWHRFQRRVWTPVFLQDSRESFSSVQGMETFFEQLELTSTWCSNSSISIFLNELNFRGSVKRKAE